MARPPLNSLARAGAEEGKGIKAGVWHLAGLPGLEWRIGGYKADGVVKQVQSVVPPSRGTESAPRQWKVPPDVPVMVLPEHVYQALAGLAETREEMRGNPGRSESATPSDSHKNNGRHTGAESNPQEQRRRIAT